MKLCIGMIDAGKAYNAANKQFVSGIRELAQQSTKDEVIEVNNTTLAFKKCKKLLVTLQRNLHGAIKIPSVPFSLFAMSLCMGLLSKMLALFMTMPGQCEMDKKKSNYVLSTSTECNRCQFFFLYCFLFFP